MEVVLFCRPSSLQLQLYRRLLSSRAVRSCLTSAGAGGDSAQHLMCIAAMKKLCNCPSLLHPNAVTAHHAQQRENQAGQEEPEVGGVWMGGPDVAYSFFFQRLSHCSIAYFSPCYMSNLRKGQVTCRNV